MYRNRKYRGNLSNVAGTSTSSQRTNSSAAAPISHQHVASNVSVQTLSSATTTSKNVSTIPTLVSVSSSSSSGILGNEADKDKENTLEPPPAKIQKQHLPPSAHAEDEDMFVIPASQITTQSRYISQRSMLSRTQHTSQTSSSRLAKNYFEQTLIRCAVSLDVAECYVLAMDHISFVTKLRSTLAAASDGRDRKSEFVAGLEEATRDPASLIKLLSGCKVVYRNSDTSKLTQDSLVQDFLMIDCLQDELQLILFDLLKTYAVQTDGNALSLVSLILSHVKLVDQQRHGELVVEKILQILSSSPAEAAKRMIMTSLEHIIDITMHDHVLDRLFKMFPHDADLFSEETVNTFGNMSINSKTRTELRRRIVDYMTNGADLSMFPTFVHFLLQFSNNDLNSVPQLIGDLRKTLRFNYPNTNRTANDLIQRAIFDRIFTALIQSKKLYDIWLKSIQNASETEREPTVDVLVLLVMQSVNDEKRNFIENVFRKQIKLLQFTIEHLKDIIDNFSIVLHEYSRVLLEMLNNFFKDKDPIVSQFARSSYGLIYGLENLDRKVIVSKLVGFVCQVDRESDHKTEEITTNALLVLTQINNHSPSAMQIYGNQLMRILDHTEFLTLTQVRMFMDLLCSVAYPVNPSDQQHELQEHLDMLIRKQVASSFKKVNRQGIIGISRVIDHLIWQEEIIEEDTNRTYDTVDDLPDGVAQKAAKYIELMKTVSRDCPASLILCYNELAAIVSRRNKRHKVLELNSIFVAWLCDMVTDDFQQYFVAETVPTRAECRGVELDYQMCINTIEETSSVSSEVSSIAIDIGGRVLRKESSSRAYSSIEVFTSLFNLMRILHFQRNKGNLESINALLGCAIFVPKLDRDVNIFETYTDEQGVKILDILFYTINWLRVCISAFVTQDDPMIRGKVLNRLSKLIEQQNTLQQHIRSAPVAWCPPGCQTAFAKDRQTEFKKPFDKTLKKKTPSPVEEDTANMTVLTALRTQNEPTASNKMAKHTKFATLANGQFEMFTPLDPDVMLLLRETVSLQLSSDAEDVGHVLALPDYEFIIDDLVNRMEIIFGVQKPSVEQRHVASAIVSADFVSDLTKFVPNIFKNFVKLMDNLKETIANAEKETNLKYTDQANHVKYSIRLTVRLLAGLFKWNGFKEYDNQAMLCASIASITENADTDVSTLALSAIERFLAYEPYIIDLLTAVDMFHLIEALSTFVTNPNNHQYSVRLCKTYLSRRWFTMESTAERGAKCNAALDELLRGMFNRIKVSSLQQLLKQSMGDIKGLNKKDRVLSMFPCINKANFPLLFRKLCTGLIGAVGRRLDQSGPNIAHLKLWEESSAFLNDLLTVIETINIQRNFVLFLKYGHIYVKLFLQHGLPMLDKCFRQYADRVREVLRSLQNTTRFLHRLCCHSKTIQISAIVAQIPLLRESIETLLVRVKALLVANKCCTNDIWEIGSLKNKDLHGQVLDEVEIDVGDGGDSVIPDDDELDDTNLDDEDEARTEKINDTTRTRSRNSSRSRVF